MHDPFAWSQEEPGIFISAHNVEIKTSSTPSNRWCSGCREIISTGQRSKSIWARESWKGGGEAGMHLKLHGLAAMPREKCWLFLWYRVAHSCWVWRASSNCEGAVCPCSVISQVRVSGFWDMFYFGSSVWRGKCYQVFSSHTNWLSQGFLTC